LLRNIYFYRTIILILSIGIWQIVSLLPFVSPLIIASPIDVLSSLIQTISLSNPRIPDFYLHLQRTIFELLIAYIIVVGIGLSVGIVFGKYSRIAASYEPLLMIYMAFPTIILFPLIFMIFGSDEISKIAYGVLIGFPYIIFNTSAGIKQVDKGLLNLSRTLGHSNLAIIYKVTLPSALPTLIGGFRLGFAFTFIGVIVGEIINAGVGLGYLLNWSRLSFFTPELYTVILATLSIGLFGDTIFRIIGNRLMKWRY